VLVLNNVQVFYQNSILVLRGISLEVREREIVCLLGANGAGKTTTLKAISGLLKTEEGKVTQGSIEFEGIRIDNRYSPNQIVKKGIVQSMEGGSAFKHFTVEEQLKLGQYNGNRGSRKLKSDLDMVYCYLPRLKELRHRTSGLLSGGERQMLEIGRSLIAHPKLILLDEPSLGLSPILVQEIFRIIKEINAEEKTTLLLVEQNAMVALSVADRGYFMDQGRIVLEGPSPKLRENEDVKEFYLGLSEIGERKSYRHVKHYRRRKRWLS